MYKYPIAHKAAIHASFSKYSCFFHESWLGQKLIIISGMSELEEAMFKNSLSEKETMFSIT